ncbi:hypothetical protein [Acidisoma sp.]|uniref:hypothetical protein n=1 Tax=Acidisoma sp. TaxID=1872115 RepID=UPI003AFF9C53
MPRSTKTKLAIPVLIVVVAAIAGGYQVFAQHQARASLNAALANLPPGSVSRYDTMSFNAFTQTLRVAGLSITRNGHPSFAIQNATLHHIAGSGTLADPLRASSVHLVGTTIWRGSRSLTVGLADGQNIAVLAPGVPPPQGTPNWLVTPRNGTLLSAGSITVSNIADDEGATLAAFSIADYGGGQVRQASARGFADMRGNRIATAAAHAVDLDGLDAVFDTGRYTKDQPERTAPRPLIGRAEIMGFRSQGDDGSATIDSLTLDGFAARPFAAAPTSAYVKSQAFARDAAAAISVGAAALTGLRYHDDRTKLSGALSALSLSGYADGALAQASLDGLALTGDGPSQITVGHFQLTGFNATKLLHDTAAVSRKELVAAARQGEVHLGSFALDKVAVTPPTGQTITLESADQSTTGSAPTHFKARLRGLAIPAQSNPELAQGLGALGVNQLVLDLDEAGSYDTARGTADLAPMVLTAQGLGSLSLSAKFTDVPQDLSQTGSALAALGGIGLGPFKIRFTNDTLVQRIIAMQARAASKTPDDITDEAKLAGSFAAAALVPGQPDAGQQIAAFIANPRALTITATPAAPVPFAALLGPERDNARNALNLQLSAN